MNFTIEKQNGMFNVNGIYEYLRDAKDGIYRASVERVRFERTNPQNGWLWGCIYPMLLDAMNYAGWTFTDTKQLHEFFKSTLAKTRVVNDVTGEVIEFPSSTADMDTIQFSTYCEQLRQYGREYLGIEIPDPKM